MSGADTLGNTGDIREWRSIVTLVVFVLANCIVLFPFHLPIPVPQSLRDGWWDLLASWRIIPKRRKEQHANKWRFPVDLTTGPLIGVLFLLAILAIGRQEVHDGTVGADHIYPIDVMVFFVTLAYIAISIDASGLIRFLSFKVLQKGGKNGRLLFLYLYLFFFACASFVGNDPIVLSGTAFLAYLTRVSRNISEPTAWIFTQFSIANLASAILVSSNPTNLVLAGAFDIQYIEYTANMIVPVIVTAIVLCPFLIFVQFRSTKLIPREIELHELPEERQGRDPVNPNIPSARAERAEKEQDEEEEQLISLEEILNPYLDKKSAIFAGTVMAITLISVLALNAVADKFPSGFQVYWVTLPAAVIVFSWDLTYGWIHREATKETMAKLRAEVEEADAQREKRYDTVQDDTGKSSDKDIATPAAVVHRTSSGDSPSPPGDGELEKSKVANEDDIEHQHQPATLQSEIQHLYRRAQVTFPTATMVLTLLPLPLVPFGFCMFILVQALVTRGWVTVFAYGWNHWIDATGTIGAIGGMGFLGVVLCNFAGTNIGTTILLCRILQAWVTLHTAGPDNPNATPISQRTFWASVYSMALAVNYGAFSTAFSASLAGLLWRDILARKKIFVSARSFVWVNLPIITLTMVVGLVVLIGEIYLTRSTDPYVSRTA